MEKYRRNLPTISRREFLRLSGFAALGIGLAGCATNPELAQTDLPLTMTPSTTTASSPTATIEPTATSTATITPEPSQTPNPTPDLTTLRGLANALEIQIGTQLVADVPVLIPLIRREYNFGVVNGPWRLREKSPGVFKWGPSDDRANLAKKNEVKARFHHIFDAVDVPDWLVQGNYTREEFAAHMKKWVKTLAQHFDTEFPGVIEQYNVVNEIHTADREDYFYRVFGFDYVKMAFEFTREAFSKASKMPRLLYSDTGNLDSDPYNGRQTELTMKFTEMLRTEGLVDGVSVQGHIRASTPPDKSDMVKTFRAYGLPVYITECDVSLVKIGGSQEKRFQLQADIFQSVVEAALDSGVCNSITFWDTGDQYSWFEQPEFKMHPLAGSDADPTLFDDQLQPKPAYFAVFNVLKNQLTKRT